MAPWRCAIATISATGVMVPSAFETCVNETSVVRGLSSFSYSSRMTWPRVVDRRDAQPAPFSARELLPRHDVGVVLELRDDDLVARADVAAAPALGDEVDALGRAAHEDDLSGDGALRNAAHLVARAFVGVGRARRQRVGGAVDVRVLVLVEVREAIDHALRLLRGRGVVEPDERAAVDPFCCRIGKSRLIAYGSNGRTPLMPVAGAPAPGRCWKFSPLRSSTDA